MSSAPAPSIPMRLSLAPESKSRCQICTGFPCRYPGLIKHLSRVSDAYRVLCDITENYNWYSISKTDRNVAYLIRLSDSAEMSYLTVERGWIVALPENIQQSIVAAFFGIILYPHNLRVTCSGTFSLKTSNAEPVQKRCSLQSLRSLVLKLVTVIPSVDCPCQQSLPLRTTKPQNLTAGLISVDGTWGFEP